MKLDDPRLLPIAHVPLVEPPRDDTKVRRKSVSLFAGYRPHAKQLEVHQSKARFKAICAGRRGGKTVCGARDFLDRVFKDFRRYRAQGGRWARPARIGGETKPALSYWCVAPTYKLGNLQRAEIFEALGGIESPLILRFNRNAQRLWLRGGIRIEFRSAHNPLMLVGENLHGVWVDEAARLKEEAWVDNIYPNLWGTGGWAVFTTTPLGRNWFWRDIWSRTQLGLDPADRDPEYQGFHFVTTDNTRVPGLVREAELARERLPAAVYQRNYAASFDAFEGKIFPSFEDDARHVIDAIPWGRLVHRWGGIDWGTGNAGAHLELALDDEGRAYVLREDYHEGLVLSPPAHNPTAKSWLNLFRRARSRGNGHWWADPSGAGQILECQENGLDVRPAANAVVSGIEAVATLLEDTPQRGPGLFIHRSCRNLRSELVSYRWDQSGEKPVKEFDHATDALRYGIYSEHLQGGGGGIESLGWSIFESGAA